MTKHVDLTDRIWPVGTMVVLRCASSPTDGGHPRPRGACGVVTQAPASARGAYRVRFPDGGEFAVDAASLEVLKHYQDGELGDAQITAQAHDLYEHVIYRVMVGSRAYGLDHEASDVDLRGIYLPPAQLHWSIYGVPEQLERPDSDECYWELGKFIKLALKANPNVLECLYSPCVELATPLAQELLDQRHIFLSKMIYQTYNRYVMSQFKALERQRERAEVAKPKHVMHLLRLLLSGITILERGFVPVLVEEHRQRLLDIKEGVMPWSQSERWRHELHARFDQAFVASSLPERPDYAAVNALLIRARLQSVQGLR